MKRFGPGVHLLVRVFVQSHCCSLCSLLADGPPPRYGAHITRPVDLRRFPEALRKLDQVLNITPDDVDTLAYKAAIA
jgi:hypothetical protein